VVESLIETVSSVGIEGADSGGAGKIMVFWSLQLGIGKRGTHAHGALGSLVAFHKCCDLSTWKKKSKARKSRD